MSEIILEHFNQFHSDTDTSAGAIAGSGDDGGGAADTVSRGTSRGREVTITDGTACVGGNTLSFARYFDKVNAVEIDDTRFQMLLRNVALVSASWAAKILQDCDAVEKNYGEITVMRGDLTKSFASPLLKQDVFFIDPPWGGPDMMRAKAVTFPLGGMPLPTLCMTLRPFCKFVALKLSDNYDLDEFRRSGLPLTLKVSREFRNMILVLVSFCSDETET
jgi:hypothetical protein